MIQLIIFILTTILVLTGLMMMPLNRSKNNAVITLVTYILLLISLWVFALSVVNIWGVKVNLVTISVINLLIGIGAFVYTICKRKKAEYYVVWQDMVMLVALLVISLLIGMYRFGVNIDVFAYGSDDSVRHFANAKNLVNTGKLTQSRNVMYIIDMIVIKCLDPIIGENGWYRAFMIADIFLLWAMGAAFYALIRRYLTTKILNVVGIVFTLLYFLGYPLMNFLYGFEYLGAGILMITLLLWVLERVEYTDAPAWFVIVAVMLANTGVFLSYTQFAPSVIVGEGIYMIVHYRRRLKGVYGKEFWKISGEILGIIICGFGISALLGVNYVAKRYWNKIVPLFVGIVIVVAVFVVIAAAILLIKAKLQKKKIVDVLNRDVESFRKNNVLKTTIMLAFIVIVVYILYKYIFQGLIVQFAQNDQGMVLDGSIYREPYANFILLLFPAVMYVIYCIKNKKNDPSLYMLITTVIFSGWLLSAIMAGIIGSYYFYKMHFIVWLFLFWCAFRGVVTAGREPRKNLLTYGIIVLLAGIVSISGVEKHLIEGNDWLWPDSVIDRLYGVYNENIEMLESGGNVDRDMQAMYNQVKQIVDRDNTFIPYFGVELRYLREYYYYLTNQHPAWHTYELNNHNYPSFNIREDLENRGITYIFVQKDYESPSESYDMEYAVMWMEYENDYGWIYKLD